MNEIKKNQNIQKFTAVSVMPISGTKKPKSYRDIKLDTGQTVQPSVSNPKPRLVPCNTDPTIPGLGCNVFKFYFLVVCT